MPAELVKKAAKKNRHLRRQKQLLLGYVESFHKAADRQELFESLQGILREEFEVEEIRFAVRDVRSGNLVYQSPAELSGMPVPLEPDGEPSSQALPGARLEKITAAGSQRWALISNLKRDGLLLGRVELIGGAQEEPFSQADREYLEAIAPHIAIALNQFALSEESRLRGEMENRLKEVARSISSTLDLDEILQELLHHIGGLVPYDAGAIILFGSEDSLERSAFEGFLPHQQEEVKRGVEEIRKQRQQVEKGEGLVAGDFHLRQLESCAEAKSLLLMPLHHGDRLVGMFLLTCHQCGAYSKGEIELLEALSGQAALAIERAQLHKSLLEKSQLEQQVRVAREIQLRFLPSEMPAIPGVDLAAANTASQMVSGDYYDIIPIVYGQWGLVIGDVSGKGISAGMIMSAFGASLLAEIRNNFSISTILSKVNRLLWETTSPNRFVTAFYGVFDEKNRVLTYSNAGHNPPLLLRRDGSVHWLSSGGRVLGAFQHSQYEEARVDLLPGDLFVLYTDGLTESRTSNGDELGAAGLIQLVHQHKDQPAAEIARSLTQEATRYSPQQTPEDDVTLLVMKVS